MRTVKPINERQVHCDCYREREVFAAVSGSLHMFSGLPPIADEDYQNA